MLVNKLGHLVTSFFSDSLTDVAAVARGVYGGYLRGGCGDDAGTWEREAVHGMCVCVYAYQSVKHTTGINYTYLS